MKVVVLGAGTVGSSIAELLCHHRHSVTVVDNDPEKVRRLNERLDVRALTGSASGSSILFQAGVIGADLCLAMTGEDEVNLVAASIAKGLGTRRSVARVYGPVFRDLSTFDYQRHFNIDRLVSLEHLSAVELARGIRTPGSVAVESLARGELEVQELDVGQRTRAAGTLVRDLGLPKGVRIASIQRNGSVKIAAATDRLEAGDRVTIIGSSGSLDTVKDWFQRKPPPKQRVFVAGGGETGYHVAQILETGRFHVTLLESDPDRCKFLGAHLAHATVVRGNATSRQTLEEERVGSADVFIACTGDDEDNIMAGVEARELGARTIMAIVGRPDYANVVHKLGIDHVVSPRQVVAKQILGYLTTGPVLSQTKLAGGEINVLEIEVLEGVLATEHVLAQLPLPAQCVVAAVIREDYVRVPGADDRLRAGDTVVMLVENRAVTDVLRLFQNGGR